MATVIATHEGTFTCPWFGTPFEEREVALDAARTQVVLRGVAEVTDETALARYASDDRFIVQGWEPKAPEAPPADAPEPPVKKAKK